MVKRIAALPDVFCVTPNTPFVALSYDETKPGNKEARELFELDPIHEAGTTGEGITVGVLDTGIDYNHPDLAEAYVGGYDFISGDADPMETTYKDWQRSGSQEISVEYGTPYYTSHGTHVSGIIAGRGVQGTLGIAPEAKIKMYRVLGEYGASANNSAAARAADSIFFAGFCFCIVVSPFSRFLKESCFKLCRTRAPSAKSGDTASPACMSLYYSAFKKRNSIVHLFRLSATGRRETGTT